MPDHLYVFQTYVGVGVGECGVWGEEGREGKEELSVTQQSISHLVLNYSPNPALHYYSTNYYSTTSVFVDIKCYIS